MKDLYIITTARKRDTFEWDDELLHFGLSRKGKNFDGKVVIDSWNNLHKYVEHKEGRGWKPLVTDAYFIFDEQRVIGTGTWVKSFLCLAKYNEWILLSATPGDTWLDYIPVFIANGFYKNFTDFRLQHVVYNPFSKFRQVERYLNVPKLEQLRNDILVDMPFERKTVQHHEDVYVTYDIVVFNYSTTLKMTINNIVNYFDPNYELYVAGSPGWKDTGETKNGYQKAVHSTNITLEPKPKTIYLTFSSFKNFKSSISLVTSFG